MTTGLNDMPNRMSQEEAIAALLRMGFTKLEATIYLEAKTREDRLTIYNHIMKRIKEEKE